MLTVIKAVLSFCCVFAICYFGVSVVIATTSHDQFYSYYHFTELQSAKTYITLGIIILGILQLIPDKLSKN